MDTNAHSTSGLPEDFLDIRVLLHDLQAPLTGVKWSLDMLYNGDAGSLNEAQRSLVQSAKIGNERAVERVRDFLMIARLGSAAVEKTKVDIGNLVMGSVEMLSDKARRKQIHLVYHQNEAGSSIALVHEESIRIAFENLLDNAIKYSSVGDRIDIRVATNKETIEVSVFDNGPGVPREDAGHLFSKFFRGSQETITPNGGTGLGLYIARLIIENHHGKIWYKDRQRDLKEKEGGSVFGFTLPKTSVQ